MKVSLFTRGIGELKTEALVIGIYQGIDLAVVEEYDDLCEGLIGDVIRDKEFSGKFGQICLLRLKNKIKRVILIGLGKKDEFDSNKAKEIAGKAAIFARDSGFKEFSFLIFEELLPYGAAYNILEGIKLALYQFVDFKTQELDEIKKVEQFTLVASGNNFIEVDKAIRNALVVMDAVYYVRDLQNKPSNVVTPDYLTKEAVKLAKRLELRCSILETNDLKRLKMGGLLAVSSGSRYSPKLIVLEYNSGEEAICFVGKGVTFDSGGISLKPAADMDEMKFDMSGGATVLGIMQVVSTLKMPYKIIGLIPIAENLPGTNAYKPGDVVRHYNGKTSEIVNTDAEGRLILADALAYSKKFNPKVVIDFATLTGACVVSLGDVYSGMFSNDEDLAGRIINAGEKTGEFVWRLPLHEKYKEHIKSNVADLKNAGPKEAGAITAAMFLREFIDCKKWAHLDIAGTAAVKNSKDVLRPSGGTGYGVRLAVQLLEDWKSS